MNDIETIDGIKGEWRTVTKPEEVNVGQRVRYDIFGYITSGLNESRERHITSISNGVVKTNGCRDLFTNWPNCTQAFFPLPAKPKRKVAKVRIKDYVDSHVVAINFLNYSWFRVYKKRKSALRGARRFCNAIGYECEVVK